MALGGVGAAAAAVTFVSVSLVSVTEGGLTSFSLFNEEVLSSLLSATMRGGSVNGILSGSLLG